MRRRALRAALVFASFLCPLAALADEPAASPAPPADEKKPKEPAEKTKPLEVVITGTRSPEDAQRSTVRTVIVTRDEAERRGATDVGQALQGQLGVQVNPSAYGYLGNPSAIQIQGFDRDRVLILEDGERVVGDVGGAIDLGSMPLTDVSRIELVTGPTSSLYGTSAIGGVVNVLTAPPEVEGFSARARAEGRSRYGLLLQGNGAYRKNDTWAGLDLSYQRGDGTALSSELPDLALPSTSRGLIGLRAGARVGDHIEVRVRGRWIRDGALGLESQVLPGLKKRFLIDLPETTDRFTLNVTEEMDLGGGLGVRLSLGKQWYLGETRRDRRDSPADDTRERLDEMQSFEATATLAEGTRTWTLGARAEAEQFEQSISTIKPLGSELITTTTNEVPKTNLGSAALYGQLAWKLRDWVTVLAGTRGELHLRYGGVVAPRLAVALRPSPKLTLRASAGRGFRAPSAKEFGFSFDHTFYGYIVIGNPDLAPETSWGVNGDISFSPQRGLIFRAGGYANWINDLIDVDLDPKITPAGISVYEYRNIGRARTAGGEIDASWRPAKWLKLDAGYAYLWTRNDTDERPLEGRPPHTIYTSVLLTLPWKLEAYGRFRTVTSAFIDESVRSPGFSTLDARIGRALWSKAQVYAGATNLLGEQKDPARLGDQRPIEGRTFYIGIRSEYPLGED